MAVHGTDSNLARALSHPLRLRILMAVGGRVASPRELADELDAPLGDVAYHVKQLAKSDLLELVRTERRRGAVKHFYGVKRWLDVADAEWAAMPLTERRDLSRRMASQLMAELQGAEASGNLAEVQVHLSRSPLMLDAPAIEELNLLLRGVVEQAQRLHAESKDRSAQRGAAHQTRTLTILHFGSPHRAPS